MPLYLPRNLIRLAKLTSAEQRRYPVHCVRVLDPGDGTYRCEATDGRILGIVRGQSLDVTYPVVEEAPNGAREALVSAKDWTNAFRLHGRKDPIGLARSQTEEVSDCGGEEVQNVERTCLFASDQAILTCSTEEGEYPPVNEVLPKHGPLVTFTLDPAMLARLLEVVLAIRDDEYRAVKIHYYGKNAVVGLTARNAQGQFFDGLIVPLS
jgi:hypothetical protein